ncbi:hypothetical protein HDU67_005637, partial [Dinochytrium kinnereticum]
ECKSIMYTIESGKMEMKKPMIIHEDNSAVVSIVKTKVEPMTIDTLIQSSSKFVKRLRMELSVWIILQEKHNLKIC